MEEQACTRDKLADICHAWVNIEEDEEIMNDDVEEAMEEWVSTLPLPTFTNFDSDCLDVDDALDTVQVFF